MIPPTAHIIGELGDACRKAAASTHTTLIHLGTDPYGPRPPASAWLAVPVSQTSRIQTSQIQTSQIQSTRQAYTPYQRHKQGQRHHV